MLLVMQVHHEDSQLGMDSNYEDTFRAEIISQDDLDVKDGMDLPCSHVSPIDNRRVNCAYPLNQVCSPKSWLCHM